MKIKIVGCGLSGITTAILLKEKGHDVRIFEQRSHIGGNCYDSYLNNTLIHNYGPHLFHTNDDEVFHFLSRYTEWFPFYNRPLGNTNLGIISLPYSKKTIKELGRELTQEEIINIIFKGYSEKQWGVPFDQIPASITNRIPKTKDCDNPSWYEGEKYQCLPKQGYTAMMQNMLQDIPVELGCKPDEWLYYKADLAVYTGRIDEYYKFTYGKLPYRTLDFVHRTSRDRQINPIINQNKSSVLFTRSYDHGYFSEKHEGNTIITEEYSRSHIEGDVPFYPIPFGEGLQLYAKYKQLADYSDTIFLGRLATYTYLDMWMTIKQAMKKINSLD